MVAEGSCEESEVSESSKTSEEGERSSDSEMGHISYPVPEAAWIH